MLAFPADNRSYLFHSLRQYTRQLNPTVKQQYNNTANAEITPFITQCHDTFALVLNFEVDHFSRHFLLLSFWCCYERNSFHTALMFVRLTTCFLSSRGRLLDFHKRRLFYLHIQRPLVVSLNYKPQLAHWRQLPAGSAFQFYYT